MTRRGLGMLIAAAALLLTLPGASRPPASPSPQPTPLIVPSATTRPTPPRAPIPDLATQARAGRLLQEVFRTEYASADRHQRCAFARKLMRQAADTPADTPARFVLLREARDIAADAGDAALAAHAIDLLERHFFIDAARMHLVTARAAAKVASTAAHNRDLAHVAFRAASDAVQHDEYATADALMDVATAAASRAQDPHLATLAAQLAREIQSLARDYRQLIAAEASLPDLDPQRRTLLGRHLCLVRGDFDRGLPLLAQGSDPSLRGLANAELAAPANPAERVRLAHAWWDLAAAHGSIPAANLRRHAADIYLRALPNLKGLDRAAAEKRLELYFDALIQRRGLRPGLLAELHRGTAFQPPVISRVDPIIDFDWGQQSPHPALPKDNFSIRWTGVLKVALGGRYELVVIANAGARLAINGQLLLDEPALSRRRNGARLLLQLPAGLHELMLEYWDTSGTAKMRLLWRPPGTADDAPIPASAWWHEGGLHP